MKPSELFLQQMLVLGLILGTINLLVYIRIEKSKENLTFATINF